MTRVLLKHEYLRTRQPLLIIWGVAALGCGFGCLLALTSFPILPSLGAAIAAVMTMLIIPGTQLYLGIDFWLSSFRREGYFTQTLPIPGAQIYRAKLLWGALVSLVSVLIAAGMAALIITVPGWWAEVGEILSLARQYLLPTWMWALFITVLAVTYLFWGIISYFFAATLGSREPLSNLSFGGPVIVVVCTYIATQILLFISILSIPAVITWNGNAFALEWMNIIPLLTSGSSSVVPVGWLPIMPLLAVVMVWWTLRLWKRGASLS